MNQIEKYRLSHTRLPVGQFHGEVGFSLFRSRHGSHQMALMISWCCPAQVIPYAQTSAADHRATMTGRGIEGEEEENLWAFTHLFKSATFRQPWDSRFVPKSYFEPSPHRQSRERSSRDSTSRNKRIPRLGNRPSFDLSQGSHQAALEIFQIFLLNISNISRKKRIIHYKIISIEREICRKCFK